MMTFAKTLAPVMFLLLALAGCKKEDDVKPADPTAAFVGEFEVQTPDPEDRYTITFAKDDSEPGTLKISNFGDVIKKNKVYGQVTGNKLTIPTQKFPTTSGKMLSFTGEGTLEGNTLTLHYKAGADYTGEWHVTAQRKSHR